MNTCFIYCRKSSEDKERQILSLDDQERTCKELAKDKGFAVLGVYKESKSAKRPDHRPEFSAMVERVSKGEVKHILCWKADRLCRNAKEGGTLIDHVDYNGMLIVTPTMDYDRNNSTFLFIEFGMATKFSKDLSDNVKRGMNTKVQNGWRPGSAPLGYMNDFFKPKGQKEVLPDPERFDLCRKWWEIMMTGEETVVSSLKKITAMGLRGKRKSGKPVSTTEAFRFFRNIFYTGMFDYNGERHIGKHKSMITLDEYQRVQDIIDGRKRVFKQRNNFYFMKLLKCGECGAAITADRKTKHYKRSGTSQIFIYARCTKKLGPCHQQYLNADEVEKQVREFIASLEIKPAFVEWIKKSLKRRNEREFDFERAQKGKLSKRLDTILVEKKTLYGMKIDGMIGEEEYQKEKARLLTEEKQTKEGIEVDGVASWTKTMEETLHFAANVTRIFNIDDIEVKRAVLRILGSNLFLKDRLVRINGKKAFVFLKTAEKAFNEKKGRLEPENSLITRDNTTLSKNDSDMERVKGVEPSSHPWEGRILPVNHTRILTLKVIILEFDKKQAGAWK